MSEQKPRPLYTASARGVCPVCGKTSYSHTGTHPQCAVARADALMRAAIKASGAVEKKAPNRKSWSKPCPKCKQQVPARRFVCDCGHQFSPVDQAKAVVAGSEKPR
jgi:hypothetical protein